MARKRTTKTTRPIYAPSAGAMMMSSPPVRDPKTDAKPEVGIVTRRQPTARLNTQGGFCGTGGMGFGGMGYSEPPAGTFALYRKMRGNPTIALAYAATVAPVQFAPWTFKAADGVPDEWVKFAQDQMDRIKWDFVEQAVRRLYYGFQSFERVYEVRDGRLCIDRLKPLLPDITKAVVDETGTLIGLENERVRVSSDKIVWTTYDSEADDPYGRSLMENLRTVWHNWCESAKNLGRYVVKNAGIIPIVMYPPSGRGTDADGSVDDNVQHARNLLSNLFSAQGVMIPMEIDALFDGVAGDVLRSGVDVSQLLSWQIKTLDFKSGAGAEIVDSMKHDEALMVRGFLRPERSLLESENGSRADAVAHTDTGLAESDKLHRQNVEYANEILEDLMVANFGERAEDAVTIEPGSLTQEDKTFFRNFAKDVLAAPGNIDLLLATTDFDALMDKGEIPKSQEVIDLSSVPMTDPAKTDTNAPTDPNADPNQQQPDRNAGVKQGVETAVADLALNGAQVQSMVTLAQQLASGQLPREAVREIMLAAFPNIPQDRINRIVSVLDKFTPPKPDEPKPAPAPKLSRSARVLAARMRERALV